LNGLDALDSEITEDDIIKAIAKLKPEKSAGSDNIIGEIFTASPIFLEIVSLSTAHFGFRFGLTADQNFLGSVFAILQSSIPFLRLKVACALRLVLLNRFLAEMYE
jgi:hypothetical protein